MKRQRRIRTLAVLLVFGLLLSWMPAGVIALPDQTTTTAAGAAAELSPSTFQLDADCQLLQYVDEAVFAAGNHVARLKEKETLSTYVFLNADGTQTVYYMDQNVKFIDQNGAVREKDISLAATRSGFSTASNDVGLVLPNDLTQGITLSYSGYDVTMIPEGITAATVQQQDGKIAYLNCYGKGTGLIYTPTLAGLKEDILLTEYTGVNSFSFLLNTDGLRPYQDGQGRYYFAKSADAEFKLELADIVAYDANARFSLGSVTVTPITMGQQYRLTVTVDAEFLTAETTAYPVYIDPTITVLDSTTGSNAIEDATVYEGQPTLNTGTWQFNHAGYYSDTYKTGRIVYRLTGLLSNTTYQGITASEIESAYFYLTEATGSAGKTVTLHALSSNSTWTETTVTWSNVGSYDATVQAQNLLSYNETAEFDITNLVKAWKNGSYSGGQCGIVAKLAEGESGYKGIISSEYSSTNKRPYVVVTYSTASSSATIPDGQYLISQDVNTRYLTPDIISYASGTGIDIQDRSIETPVALSQIWNVTHQGNGQYTISTIYKSDLHLIANDSMAMLSNNTSGYAHQWTITLEDGAYVIKSCADPTLALTGTLGTDGVATVWPYDQSRGDQSWVMTPVTAQGMMLLDSETGERRDASGYYDAVAMGQSETKTLSGLGLTLHIFDPYNSSTAFVCSITNTSIASFNTANYSISGLAIGNTAVRIQRTINGTLQEVVFSLRVCKTISVSVLYDNGYAARYGSSAQSMVSMQMEKVKKTFLKKFSVAIVYSTPTRFQSYADTCSLAYNAICTHTCTDPDCEHYGHAGSDYCEESTCIDSGYDNYGNIAIHEYHHKNIHHTGYRLAAAAENAKVIAFIGHYVCCYGTDTLGNSVHCQNTASETKTYGVAYPTRGVALNADHSDSGTTNPAHAIATSVHEFGHLLGAPDHYGQGCPSTTALNNQTGSTLYNPLCIYGELKDDPDANVYENLTICAGCRQSILAQLNGS